eukprot:scaffold185555_cov34-Tisochrysis_lutea.AAC.1
MPTCGPHLAINRASSRGPSAAQSTHTLTHSPRLPSVPHEPHVKNDRELLQHSLWPSRNRPGIPETLPPGDTMKSLLHPCCCLARALLPIPCPDPAMKMSLPYCTHSPRALSRASSAAPLASRPLLYRRQHTASSRHVDSLSQPAAISMATPPPPSPFCAGSSALP